MDELSTLRNTRADVAPPTREALERGRAALFERIENGTPSRQPDQRIRRRRLGVVVAGAGALAVALVMTGVVVPQLGAGSSAQAAALLTTAAQATITAKDPVVGPGQYLQIDTTMRGLSTGIETSGEAVTWMEGTHNVLYIPSDRNSTWIWDRHLIAPFAFQNAAAKTMALEDFAAQRGNADTDSIVRGAGGKFYGTAAPAANDFFGTDTVTKSLDQLPTDPAALREYLRKTWNTGASGSEEQDAWVRITQLLEDGTATAKLRSALYQVAAMIPGISITNNSTTLDGRTGTAIGRTVDGVRSDIIIDPSDGDFIGGRTVTLTPLYGWPAGTSTESSSVTTSVVDTAP
ncbi:hypothetical protein GCM10025867_19520 [Frondihabitans sucicola]|uniref:Uncharacterized protein n=1 Tax=Frondihabitans sucicola TaxID=1268041 RepID=A0ABM8GMP4_9MICO|nr:CU044_5270 family protein [Frondihabitans sucicola]BDZ49711.1 hypothetical protein GCM10025867_19520 [Frondihabitans sucicola]